MNLMLTSRLRHLAANTKTVDLVFKYQGCAKAGLCYPPITKNITVNLDSASGAAAAGELKFSAGSASSGGSGSGVEFTNPSKTKLPAHSPQGKCYLRYFSFLVWVYFSPLHLACSQ